MRDLPTESTIFVACPLPRAAATSFLSVSWLPVSQLIPATPLGVANAAKTYISAWHEAYSHSELCAPKNSTLNFEKSIVCAGSVSADHDG